MNVREAYVAVVCVSADAIGHFISIDIYHIALLIEFVYFAWKSATTFMMLDEFVLDNQSNL